MICDDVIYFVTESPEAHGVFNKPTETQRMCYCRVNSVTRSEFYRARENGIQPQLVFVISEYADYNGEKVIIYNGKRYRVIRSYVKNHAVELTVGEATADAALPVITSTTGTEETHETADSDSNG